MPIPTWRLLVLLLLAAPIWALSSVAGSIAVLAPVYLLLLALLCVYDLRCARQRQHLSAERHHDSRFSLGGTNSVTVTVRAKSAGTPDSTPWNLWLRDETPPEIPGGQPVIEGTIRPGGEWQATYELTPVRRGNYQFGDVWIRLETPLKLFVRQTKFPLSEDVRVYPNLRAIQRYDLMAQQGRLAEVGVHRTRYLGRGNEFERLRDYQPDDEYRRINWKATARRLHPVTVEYETERSQNLLLMIDTGRMMGAPVGELNKLDHALNSALLLAYVASKMGDRVGALSCDDRVRAFVPPARGARQFQLLLDALHGVEAQPVESDLRRTVSFLASRHQRRSLVIFFTDLAAETDASTIIPSLQLLSRRHLVVCASLSDPDLENMSRQLPEDSMGAYEKVVAQRLIDERHALVETLARFGVATIEGTPESLSPAVINHYLETKARARL